MDLDMLRVVAEASGKVREACDERGTFNMEAEEAQDAFRLVAYALLAIHKNKKDIFKALVTSNLHAIESSIPESGVWTGDKLFAALAQTMMMSLYTYDHIVEILHGKTQKEAEGEATDTVKAES
jgi:hypothetical protein